MTAERRDPVRRAAFVRAVLEEVVHNPAPQLSSTTVQQLLRVSPDIASRVLERLSEAGVFRRISRDVWARVIPTPFVDRL